MRKIKTEILLQVLTKMLGADILQADCQIVQLKGGTVGDVQLVAGIAETAGGSKLPYKVVFKIQKKWERYGDPDSWRREYDFYKSDFGTLFSDSFRWAECYHAEINEEETETQIWLEYIDGVSGLDLTSPMLEAAAYEIGRFQGKLYAEAPAVLQNLKNLSKVSDLKDYYLYCRAWEPGNLYIRSDDCEFPTHLREMLIEADKNADAIWERIEKLPIVMCHRDFWVTNIFYADEKIVLIDWDTSGWGYFGEDIKQLVTDEIDAEYMVEYYQKCVPAYFKGFSEYADITHIPRDCIREMILVCSSYGFVKAYMEAKSPEEKTLQLNILQKVYEIGDIM